MTFEQIIRELQEKLGGGIDLKPNQDGIVTLDVDGMPLTIMDLPQLEQLALSAPVGQPPPADHPEVLYKAMLTANHFFAGTAGATLSVNPETNDITLFRIVAISDMNGDMLYRLVEGFINTLDTWRELVSNYRDAGSGADGVKNGDGFMQVQV